MLDQAHDFVRASGALAAICYREDIEVALRTPGFGGFQLLDIQDFPGQGTALVGMLNVFMESKGMIEPEKWRQFCSETVPLLRMEKYTWTTRRDVQRARCRSPTTARPTCPTRRSPRPSRTTRAASSPPRDFHPTTIKQGEACARSANTRCRSVPPASTAPQKLTLTLAIEGPQYRNNYPIWVYPPKVDTSRAAGRDGRRSASRRRKPRNTSRPAARSCCFPKLDQLPHSVPGGFQTEFWSPMFAKAAEKRGERTAPGHARHSLRSGIARPGRLSHRVPQQLAVVAAREKLAADQLRRHARRLSARSSR